MSSSPPMSALFCDWLDAVVETMEAVQQEATSSSSTTLESSTTSSLPHDLNAGLVVPGGQYPFTYSSTSSGYHNYPVPGAPEVQEANISALTATSEYAQSSFPFDQCNPEALRALEAAMSSNEAEQATVPYPVFPDQAGQFFNPPQAPSLPPQYQYQHHSQASRDQGYFYVPHPHPPLPSFGTAPSNPNVTQFSHQYHRYGHQFNPQDLEAASAYFSAGPFAPPEQIGANFSAKPLSATGRPNEPARRHQGASTSAKKSVGAADTKGKGKAKEIRENVEYIEEDASTSVFQGTTDEPARPAHPALYSATNPRPVDGHGEGATDVQYKFVNMNADAPPKKRGRTTDTNSSNSSNTSDDPKKIRRTYTEISPGAYECPLCDEKLTTTSAKKHGGQCICGICGFTTVNRRKDSLRVHQRSKKCKAAAALKQQPAAVPVGITAWAGAPFTFTSAINPLNGDHEHDTNDGGFEGRAEDGGLYTVEDEEENEAGPSSTPLEDVKNPTRSKARKN